MGGEGKYAILSARLPSLPRHSSELWHPTSASNNNPPGLRVTNCQTNGTINHPPYGPYIYVWGTTSQQPPEGCYLRVVVDTIQVTIELGSRYLSLG
mgnify:CR=1 FL=1